MEIYGFCAPGLEALYSTFAENFAQRGDTGASFAAVHHGELIVSLAAGTRDRDGSLPYSEETLVNVFSASKGVLAALVLQQVAQGNLSLDAPVCAYWPEFAAGGKQEITVGQLLSHRSGLNAFQRKVPDGLIYSWADAVREIEQTAPYWEPGRVQGYSPFLYGWSLGELLQRVTGRRLEALYRASMAEPLELDGGFGAVGHSSTLVADVQPLKVALGQGGGLVAEAIRADRKGMVAKAFTNPVSLMLGTNSRAWREALIPAANGHFSARDLARIYGDMASSGEVLGARGLELALTPQSSAKDATLQAELAFSYGFMLQGERPDLDYGSALSFGHPGAGGSVGFADPEQGLGIGYTTARLGQSLLMDERAMQLVRQLRGLI
ncbi:serine hydrolase domain-containing protein [Biformimicrobium ophioploci]|uniref:Serine hydrolase domain-containing protein n=1 Tax=Biformimicrobium ophioploci TaxID=3036711 RepID=A0ABQ6M177_9GAMM|nr:serine hydrolase domain-containing protein [Microbulbifer sp. NKW57]GMG88110.1 serine hydrolase domain-containing protein [Microbulbifer sp. NKW57]